MRSTDRGPTLLTIPIELATAADPVKTPGKRCPYLFNATTDDGQDVVVHTPGLMLGGYVSPGRQLLVQPITSTPKTTRHSTHSLLAILDGELWIGANPYIANTVAQLVIERGLIAEIDRYNIIQSEVKIEHHRYDFCVDGRPIEVKSSSFAFDRIGVFPVQLLSDMHKKRSYKEPTSTRFVSQIEHLDSLGDGCVLMVVQRSDCERFCINPLDTITDRLVKASRCRKIAIKIGWDLDVDKKEVFCVIIILKTQKKI